MSGREERSSLVYDDPKSSGGFATKRVVIIAVILVALVLTAVVVSIAVTQSGDSDNPPKDPLERAKYLQSKVPLTDGHNDLPWVYRQYLGGNVSALDINHNQTGTGVNTDIPRLRAGMVGAQLWSVYIPCQWADFGVQATLEQINIVYEMVSTYSSAFQHAYTVADVDVAFKNKKIASLIGMEGGHSINSSIGALRMFYQLGARYMTLTHTCSTPWAQSANDNSGAVIGLTPYGKEIVLEMNRLGMLVDISHVATQTMYDALNTSRAPVIFSHSNARTLCDNPRNVPDDVLHKLKENNGVIMIVFYSLFVCQNYTDGDVCTLNDVADHIDYVKNLIGVDHIGLGSDFDGVDNVLPVGLTDVSKYVDLTAELVRRGYSDDDILKIISKNIMRVLARAEQVSVEMAVEEGRRV